MNFNVKKLQIHLTGAALLLLCLAGAFVFGLRPVLSTQYHHQLAFEEAAHLEQILPMLEEEMLTLNQTIASKRQELEERYPLKTQASKPLLGTVSSLLSKRQITLNNLREEEQKSNGELTIVLHANSLYEDVLYFVDDLRKLDCPARISNFQLTPTDELGQRCTVKITVRFFPAVPMPNI